MIPNAEHVIAEYLRDSDDVAALIGRRVVVTSPEERSTAWVKLSLLDAADGFQSRSEHLINFLVQLDCYAGEDRPGEAHGQPEASTLARTVRAALAAMPESDFEDVVVTGVRFVGMPRIPDTDGFEPERQRYALTAQIWMHSR